MISPMAEGQDRDALARALLTPISFGMSAVSAVVELVGAIPRLIDSLERIASFGDQLDRVAVPLEQIAEFRATLDEIGTFGATLDQLVPFIPQLQESIGSPDGAAAQLSQAVQPLQGVAQRVNRLVGGRRSESTTFVP